LKINRLHGFDISYTEARGIQQRLSKTIKIEGGPALDKVKTVAGCDCAFDKRGKRVLGALVLMSFPELEVIGKNTAQAPLRFPYVPGYLSFRELEVLLMLFERLTEIPDVVLVDGQGIAHPRGIGLASHLGIFIGIPTVGCAKSRLVGDCTMPGIGKNLWEPIKFKNRTIGSILRTKHNVKPMYISPGHLVGIDRARELVIACTTRYRLPEPTRLADIEVAKYKKEVVHV